eukprot:UN02721
MVSKAENLTTKQKLSEVIFDVQVEGALSGNNKLMAKTMVFQMNIKSSVGDSWTVSKSWDTLSEFDKKLRANPLLKYMKFPDLQRGPMFSSQDDLLETRRRSIQAWLRTLLQRNIFASNNETIKFKMYR